MATFTFKPKYGASQAKAPRVKSAQFGDGYEQRVGDGINLIRRPWPLNFEGTKAEIEEIDTFLENERGITSFNWTPPIGLAGKFICREWATAINEYDNWTLNATFQEVMGE